MENMIVEDTAIRKRKDNIKDFFSKYIRDNYDKIFIVILVLAFIIRFLMFLKTGNQPLWWDEADYMAYAKNLAGLNTQWIITGPHSSIFPYFVAVFFKLGFSEQVIKFSLLFIPSFLLVLLTYKVCILLYKDKRIALISAFLMATFWPILFNSTRFHVGVPGLFFAFIAIYIFWQGFENREKIFGRINSKWAIPLAVIFILLTYATRRGYFLFGIFFIVYILSTKNIIKLLKNKYIWIGLILAIGLFLGVEKFIFTEAIADSSSQYFHPENPLGFAALGVFGLYFKNMSTPFSSFLFSPLFYLFILGIILLIFNLVISFGHIRNNKELKSDLFVFLTIFLTLAYFIFYQRDLSVGEPRWYFPLLLGSLICVSKGTLMVANFFKRYHKYLPLTIIVLLIGFGGYHEVKHADNIINIKLGSYQGIKDAGLFLKEVSEEEDIFVAVPIPQPSYYGERKGIQPRILLNKESNKDTNLEEFLIMLRKEENSNLKYLLVSFSEPNHPEWMKQVKYMQDPQTGQTRVSNWEIPFMNTTIDFLNGQQHVEQSKKYEDIEFRFIKIFQDVFVYEIIHY